METNVVKVKIWDLDMWMPSGGSCIKYAHEFHEKNGFVGKGLGLFLNYR